ncbi:hypothetical protein C808_01441 [Lachnospiraceae bacterium M18-1]|nr:hypothetical protein C808_01441 [Lachnospiraceae bacterium M18-1]
MEDRAEIVRRGDGCRDIAIRENLMKVSEAINTTHDYE